MIDDNNNNNQIVVCDWVKLTTNYIAVHNAIFGEKSVVSANDWEQACVNIEIDPESLTELTRLRHLYLEALFFRYERSIIQDVPQSIHKWVYLVDYSVSYCFFIIIYCNKTHKS